MGQRVKQLERLLGAAHGLNDVKAANDLASVLADSLNEFRNNTGGVVVSGTPGRGSVVAGGGASGSFSGGGGGGGGGNAVGSRLDDVLQRTFNHSTTKVLREKSQERVLAGAMRAVSNSMSPI